MPHNKRKRSFIIYNLVTTAAEEALIIVGLLVILPRLGVNLDIWIVIIAAAAWAAWSYFTFRLGVRAIERTPVVGVEALVGQRCKTATRLSPQGYVQIGSELWKARAVSGEIDAGIEVLIVEVKGLTLLVTPFLDTPTAK